MLFKFITFLSSPCQVLVLISPINMLGIVNGVETDEPEWMKDFRLKKEKRAEEEKRRREREDQKKQAIPSWKREILVKRNQKVRRG